MTFTTTGRPPRRRAPVALAVGLGALLLRVSAPAVEQEPDGAGAPADGAAVVWPEHVGAASFRALELRALSPAVLDGAESRDPGSLDPWPIDLPRDDPRWSDHWRAFARDLAAEADARRRAAATDGADGADADDRAANDLARLARLCLCAFHQDRDADGWQLLRIVATHDAARAEALLPHLLVGAPLAALSDADAGAASDAPATWSGRLAAGLCLRPALPPPDPLDPRGRPLHEPLDVTGLRIGASTVTMRLHVRGDGIDLRYRLDDGPPVEFTAVLPVPPGLRVAIEYYDWERAETRGQPLPVALSTRGEWYRLWGRVRLARRAWPIAAPSEVPHALERGGLELLVLDDDPEAAYIDGFAAACETLFPFQVHRRTPSEAAAGPSPHRIDLTEPGDARDDKLRDLAGHLEDFVLRTAAPNDRTHR